MPQPDGSAERPWTYQPLAPDEIRWYWATGPLSLKGELLNKHAGHLWNGGPNFCWNLQHGTRQTSSAKAHTYASVVQTRYHWKWHIGMTCNHWQDRAGAFHLGNMGDENCPG